MVLESTMLCVDDSEYMRNGDFIPSRLQAEQDAVSLICTCKLRVHPENNVGLMTMSQPVEVLSTLTNDTSKIFTKMHKVQPRGNPNFIAALRVAHLALKHRQGRNHKTRIVIFVGSPIAIDKSELVKVAKRLKKEKVNVDVINFSQEEDNMDLLKTFIETLNGKDGTSSHLVTVPAGSAMSEALLSSPILRSEDGTGPPGVAGIGGGIDFMVDANEDPELALALRVSMEEQRARQEEEVRRTQEASGAASGTGAVVGEETKASAKAEVMPPIAEAASTTASGNPPNFEAMTEEEQIAWALQMSLGSAGEEDGEAGGPVAKKAKAKQQQGEKMDVDEGSAAAQLQFPLSGTSEDQGEFADLLSDPAALEDLVKTLPGVNVDSKAVRDSIEKLKKDGKKPDGKAPDDKKKPSDGKPQGDDKKGEGGK